MPEKAAAPAKKVTVYIATEPFYMAETQYNPGDEVVLPGWTRDVTHDARRKEEWMGSGAPNGITFWKEGPIVDKATGERNLYRETLPVKEA